MDYKTTTLIKELEINEVLLPEIQGLYFGSIRENKAVFDYTAYFEENQIQYIDYKVFMRTNKHFIEPLIKASQKKTSELFYQNTNGHILVAAELAFIFLAFANPEMCMYFNSIITDAISYGVAYSNGFLYSMAAQRLPSEALNEIINERKNDEAGTE